MRSRYLALCVLVVCNVSQLSVAAPWSLAKDSTDSVRFYDIQIRQPGLYDILGTYKPRLPAGALVTLDDQPLAYFPEGARSVDRQTRKPKPHVVGRCALTAGKHRLKVVAARPWWEVSKKTAYTYHFEAQPVKADQPAAAVVNARDNDVYRVGETLNLQLHAQPGRSGAQYRLEVYPMRQSPDQSVGRDSASARAGKGRIQPLTLTYTFDQEGAYCYRVVDNKENVVDGPWGVVAVDTSSAARDAQQTGQPWRWDGPVVDRIDCGQPPTPKHRFRDNGTSRIVRGYRQSGPMPKDIKDGATASRKADWFAYTLNVKNPGKAHVVRVMCPDDGQRRFGINVIDPITGQHLTSGLTSGGVRPPSYTDQPVDMLVWPNGPTLDVWTCTWKLGKPAAFASIELIELDDAAMTPASVSDQRMLMQIFEEPRIGDKMFAPRWGKEKQIPHYLRYQQWEGQQYGPYHDWQTMLVSWKRYLQSSRAAGFNSLMMAVSCYSYTLWHSTHLVGWKNIFSTGYGFEPWDRVPKDQVRLVLLMCEKWGIRFVPDFAVTVNPYEGVPLDDQVRVYNNRGQASGDGGHAAFLNPLHPRVQAFTLALNDEFANRYKDSPALVGLNNRVMVMWAHRLPPLFRGMEWGYGDYTIQRFQRDTGIKVPGKRNAPNRFAQRYKFLTGPECEAWTTWRCDQMLKYHRKLRDGLRKHRPDWNLFLMQGTPRTRHMPKWIRENTPDEQAAQWMASGIDPARWEQEEGLVITQGNRTASLDYDAGGIEFWSLDTQVFANFDQRQGKPKPPVKRIHAKDMFYPIGMAGHWEYGGRWRMAKFANVLAQGNVPEVLTMQSSWNPYTPDADVRAFIEQLDQLPLTTYKPATATQDPVANHRAADGKTIYLVNLESQPMEVALTWGSTRQEALPKNVTLNAFGLHVITSDKPMTLRSLRVELPSELKQLRRITLLDLKERLNTYKPRDNGQKNYINQAKTRLIKLEALMAKGQTAAIQKALTQPWWQKVYGWVGTPPTLDFGGKLVSRLADWRRKKLIHERFSPEPVNSPLALQKHFGQGELAVAPGADLFGPMWQLSPGSTALKLPFALDMPVQFNLWARMIVGPGVGQVTLYQDDKALGVLGRSRGRLTLDDVSVPIHLDPAHTSNLRLVNESGSPAYLQQLYFEPIFTDLPGQIANVRPAGQPKTWLDKPPTQADWKPMAPKNQRSSLHGKKNIWWWQRHTYDASQARRAMLSLSFDHDVVVWVNGKRIYDSQPDKGSYRWYEPEKIVEIPLHKGKNVIDMHLKHSHVNSTRGYGELRINQ